MAQGLHAVLNAIIAADAIPPLVALLTSEQPYDQDTAAQALNNLANDLQPGKHAVIAAEARPAFTHCIAELRTA